MQPATDRTVLGDFTGARVRFHGVETTWYRRGGEFWVRTEGPDGQQHEYPVTYTFGVHPLQQYLVPLPGGRLQPLPVAWDARPRSEGGQRWFDLYPDDRFEPGEPLHWTGRAQTWNQACAECHSTDVHVNYDPERDRYDTEFAAVNVACEACHGPASLHVQWAAARTGKGPQADPHRDGDLGLVVRLAAPQRARWPIDRKTGIAHREPERPSRQEVEACGRCHSRRTSQVEPYEYGRPLTDTHRLALLDELLYFADGQIRGEVYVYGSFLQSQMYRAGVTCSDCHDPHSLRTYSTGNALCARCHASDKFDRATHSFHPPGSAGSRCVACHMPSRVYMRIDRRRDHSFRIPRPDLSDALGTPNACTDCHTTRSNQWAAARIREWTGRETPGRQFGEAIFAGRTGRADARDLLGQLADDWTQPGIARATALSLLRRYPGPETMGAIARALRNDDPLLRSGALSSLRFMEPQVRLRLAYPLLRDENRSVRLQAARALTGVPLERLPVPEGEAVRAAIGELVQSLKLHQDVSEFVVNLATVYAQTGRPRDAERSYERALQLDPGSIVARVNLADLYRDQGRDAEGEPLLREAAVLAPNSAAVHHALGLLLVRRGQAAEAVQELGQAWKIDRDNVRYGLAYALALRSRGRRPESLQVLLQLQTTAPDDLTILNALVSAYRETGDIVAARHYASRMVQLAPTDPGVQQLLRELEARD